LDTNLAASSESLNFATVTLGSETSGSMIHPAGQNSVVGLKPTVGFLSRDLVIPISEAQDTVGVFGKNVSDVKKVFDQSYYPKKFTNLRSTINFFI